METCCHSESENHTHAISSSAPLAGAPKEPKFFARENALLIFAAFLIIVQQILIFGFNLEIPTVWGFIINGITYILAGKEVLLLAWRKARRGDLFNEFVLMSVATLGAFYLGEYIEGLAVMVFYSIGEWFQEAAVKKAKGNIKALLDSRPEEVEVVVDGIVVKKLAANLKVGDVVRVKPGEKIALDGVLLSEKGVFNTAALTGESKPDTKYAGESVLAGMLNLNLLVEMRVNALFEDSKLSRILDLVQEASSRKSQTQLFISKFAKIYTPIVFFLAFALVTLPYFLISSYNFQDWLYRGLVFLVISCPCALVVSIPLGYFGGIGLASNQGILVKGGNYLDALTQFNFLVTDKTGTLTWGLFEVQEVGAFNFSEAQFLILLASLERHSTHPIAQAILKHMGPDFQAVDITQVEEVSGLGLKGVWEEKPILVGNFKLLADAGIAFPLDLQTKIGTLVLMAIDGEYVGYVVIADKIKDNAAITVTDIKAMGIEPVMLSGDRQAVVAMVAKELKIAQYYGELLPSDKVQHVEKIKAAGNKVAFIGDGINDAPVLALADVGIAMGGLGADAAIESADIVIQNDNIYKVVTAIKIAKLTRKVVWQNIILAMSVKVVVLILGAGGVATLWEAVIADVGVALLAILNAVRIQHKSFDHK
ncbi:MAG: cadmium-translocating P-type ATPase [Pedobacter sp.]|nr:MAG: cadmium-translocating P-type ATPase [Pedobacter sp.]